MKMEAITIWLDERFGINSIFEVAQKKVVPVHRHSIWYYFGGMTLFLFCVQVGTGILLLLYYRPSAENAFESVQYIMTEVHFGWLVRSVHSWSANLMILTLFIHMFSVYFMSAFRPPRELTWVTGFLLFFICICFGFSGYLLPWNELAFFATKVGTEIPGVLPVVGKPIVRFLRGGDEVTGATLTRFYGFHVAVLPLFTTGLLILHLWLVQLHGIHVPKKIKEAGVKTMKFFPNFFLRDLIGWILAIGVLAALAAIFPWELGVKADPFTPAPAGIKPEWYFLFMFQTLKYLPPRILIFEGEVVGVLAFMLGGFIWLIIPFLNKSTSSPRIKLLFTAFGVFVLAFIVVMTIVGFLF